MLWIIRACDESHPNAASFATKHCKRLVECASPHKLCTEPAYLRSTEEVATRIFRTNQLNFRKIQVVILSCGEKRKNGRRKELKRQGKNIFMDSDRGSAKNVAEKSAQSVVPLSTIPWAQTFCMTMAAVRIVHASRSIAGAAI